MNIFLLKTIFILIILLTHGAYSMPGHMPPDWLTSNEKALEEAQYRHQENMLSAPTPNHGNHHIELEQYDDTGDLHSSLNKILEGNQIGRVRVVYD